ncbi:hypothetical protein DSO57_1004539 [Entomophthora muscae]|uniref:Uncharacterized protein n=1 Tax=Entomophthora muscae TaxID=34485 RepID=A0ACC2SA69_9FUNG|nr:hypothetical protein DSO57_1004539 [Entomophthora muscae]
MTYNFQIEYTPGKKNVVPDAISRREDLDNPDTSYCTHHIQQVLEPSQFQNLIATASLYTDLDKEIQEEQLLNPSTSTTDLETRNNTWYHDNSLYIPQGPLRSKIIQAFHDTPLSGHGGITITSDKLLLTMLTGKPQLQDSNPGTLQAASPQIFGLKS